MAFLFALLLTFCAISTLIPYLLVQSAAVAGRKRLSSDTYKKLNVAGILSAAAALVAIAWSAKMKCQVIWVFLTLGLYNVAQLAACSVGLYVGKAHKK